MSILIRLPLFAVALAIGVAAAAPQLLAQDRSEVLRGTVSKSSEGVKGTCFWFTVSKSTSLKDSKTRNLSQYTCKKNIMDLGRRGIPAWVRVPNVPKKTMLEIYNTNKA